MYANLIYTPEDLETDHEFELVHTELAHADTRHHYAAIEVCCSVQVKIRLSCVWMHVALFNFISLYLCDKVACVVLGSFREKSSPDPWLKNVYDDRCNSSCSGGQFIKIHAELIDLTPNIPKGTKLRQEISLGSCLVIHE